METTGRITSPIQSYRSISGQYIPLKFGIPGKTLIRYDSSITPNTKAITQELESCTTFNLKPTVIIYCDVLDTTPNISPDFPFKTNRDPMKNTRR